MESVQRAHGPSGGQFNRGGFWALIVTQFQGAFNDNLYQFVIIFFLLSLATSTPVEATDWYGKLVGLFGTKDFVYAFASFIFAVPFIIFPALFGALADRYSKQRVALATKYLEIGIMALGGLAFVSGQPAFCWFVLFCMATQSAIFSPAKYGIIPEIMPEPRLSWANGILQMGTIIAIIAGTGMAGAISDVFRGRTYVVSLILVVLSVLGTVSAHFITKPPAANPSQRIPKNPLLPWAGMGRYFRAIWSERLLFNVVLGYVYFWFGGALVRQSVLKFGNSSLALSDAMTGYLVAMMGIGIGVGAVSAGYLSREKIETGIVPVGAIGMGFFSLILAVTGWSLGDTGGFDAASAGIAISGVMYVFVMVVMFCLGFFAGFFDVPLAAAIQARAPLDIRGGVIATTNMLTFVGIAFASILFYGLSVAGLSPSGIFFVCALMSAGMGLYICFRIPSILLRAVLWLLANSLYRIRVLGRDNVPEQGGALLAANHLSFLDALALMASTDRDIHFLMGKEVYEAPVIRRLARLLNIVALDPHGSDAHVRETMAAMRRLVAAGEVVCVPVEWRFARDGVIMPYHDDYRAILGEVEAPIVPVHLSHLWGAIYSMENGRFQAIRPPRIPHNIMVHYGPEAPRTAAAVDIRTAIQRLGTESYTRRPLAHTLLHRGFIKVARQHKRRLAIADAVTGELSFFKTLVGSIVFARKLRRILDDQPMVGVLVPPSVGGALTNIALQIMGRVPVNLNYSASKEAMASAARQCGITQALTSKRFLERLPLEVPGEAIYLEDIRATITAMDRIVGMLYALFAPAWLIERAAGSPRGRTPDDLATIIFSSGSEGEPKGVMLTQRNILSNIEAGLETFPHGPHDRMMAFLPFFHSFGFTVALWLM
ncbi:MAG TPA: MFS transporter, partial [Candidatus Hydrogenedentes bacterium]|nr:MFS transporter [Candidatus Hydrogenedentota bacterium]